MARPPSIWWHNLLPMSASTYEKDPFIAGSTQADDLGILFATIKATRPKTLVEIGFYHGDGSRALVSAADADARVFSFDIKSVPGKVPSLLDDMAQARAAGHALASWNFTQLDAQHIAAAHVDHSPVDFVFFDGPHELQTNQRIFRRLLPLLAPHAIVAVHDTGYWTTQVSTSKAGRDFLHRFCRDCETQTGQLTQRPFVLHRNSAEERRFIAWVVGGGSGAAFNQVSLHTFNYMRNGVTLLQRRWDPLPNDWRR